MLLPIIIACCNLTRDIGGIHAVRLKCGLVKIKEHYVIPYQLIRYYDKQYTIKGGIKSENFHTLQPIN